MKILLVANYIYDSMSMHLFAGMLESGIKQSGHNVLLIRPKPFFGRLKLFSKGIRKWLGYIDKFILFPFRLSKAISWADIVHVCDHSNAFYVKYCRDVPHLVTCHDLLAVRSALGEITENPTKWAGRQLQKMILNGLKKTVHIVCVSEATRNDVLRLTKLEPEDISVVYYGFNHPYSPMEGEKARDMVRSKGIEPDTPFFLHVGNDAWYKNRLGLLHIFRFIIISSGNPRYNLVFAGAGLTKEMRELAGKHNLEEKIIEVPQAEGEELRALYSTAAALLYPSLQEGFGWPIIEAQACGCPVFTTNRAPMTEAGGDGAVYIDSGRPEDAARTIVESLNSREKTADMRERGFLNIKRFTAEGMVNKYIRIYKEMCE